MSEQEVLKLVRGQLNRISDSTLEKIITTISTYYQQYPKAFVTNAIVQCISKMMTIMNDLTDQILLLSAFLSAISGMVEIGICGELLQQLFENDPTTSVSVLLCGLYHFKVIDENILIELIFQSLETMNCDVIMTIIQWSGNRIRSNNPACIRDILIKANEVIKGKELTVKEKFVVENLNDLKNNKLVGKNEENIERYKKIVQNLWKKNGVTKGLELHLTLKDLKDKTNKWWQAGSAHSEMIIEPMEIENSNETIMKAKEHHMNTETRKAIFVALMGAQDYVDGYNRIMQLNLKGEKEREIVYVLMYCLGQSKTYNKYFELIAIQLLQNIKSTKFTFQNRVFTRKYFRRQ